MLGWEHGGFTPLELLDRLAALIPPPRRQRHRYHGVLAPTRRHCLGHSGTYFPVSPYFAATGFRMP